MVRVIKQTKEDKMAMYMKLPKKQIAEMLFNCNDLIAKKAENYDVTCDSCGCHPNTIYQTNKGRFCERCKPI